jgi:3-methyladenine DNA glycosylase AlkD
MGSSPEPRHRAHEAVRELTELANPERAAGARAYFKAYDSVEFFGVSSPDTRRLAGEIYREGRDWTLRDAIRFADTLIVQPQLEAKGVGICVLGRFRSAFDDSLLATAKRWLAESCHDWASTDNLCSDVLGPLLLDRSHLIPKLRAWRNSRALYVRRASAVALVSLARRGVALDDAYEAALELADDREDLIQKATGWLLREAGKTDPARLETFLRRSGYRLGRTTVRYALERFPPALRKELLDVTRDQPRRGSAADAGRAARGRDHLNDRFVPSSRRSR